LGREERRETHVRREKEVARIRHDMKILDRKYDQSIRWEPLEKPERYGWERIFVLRQDLQNSDRAEIYTEVLTHVNCSQYSMDGKFLATEYVGKWRRRRRKRNQAKVKRIQNVKGLSDKEYEKMPDRFRKYFYHFHYHTKYGWRHEWSLINQWMFELKIIPYFVTHKRIADEGLWAEIKALQSRLWDYGSELYPYNMSHYSDSWFEEENAKRERSMSRTVMAEGAKELED